MATVYPNADPIAVEQDVTSVVESAVESATGVRRVESLSAENISLVIVEFDKGTAVGEALDDVRARLNAAAFLLPSDARAPIAIPVEPSQLPS